MRRMITHGRRITLTEAQPLINGMDAQGSKGPKGPKGPIRIATPGGRRNRIRRAGGVRQEASGWVGVGVGVRGRGGVGGFGRGWVVGLGRGRWREGGLVRGGVRGGVRRVAGRWQIGLFCDVQDDGALFLRKYSIKSRINYPASYLYFFTNH